MRSSALGLIALLAFVLCARAGEQQDQPVGIQYGEPVHLCALQNQEITESSGIACSWLQKGVFWTHNDSGDTARIFAFDVKGRNLGVFAVEGAAARDWEDMASFKVGRESYLVLADVGDNGAKRESRTIYVVHEPAIGPQGIPPGAKARLAMAVEFRYEDGPHDCESVAVDPTTRVVYLISKIVGPGARIYALPLPEKKPSVPLVAKAIASIDAPMVTAMDISPDGLRAVVLTYGDAYEYVRKPKEQWSEAFAREPRLIRMPNRAQGESICYGQDGKTLYLTSEKLPTPLWEVPVSEKQ